MAFYNMIKEIDIEHSSVCNAACPQCTRELSPGNYSWFKQTWLDTKFYQDRIPQHVLDNLDSIFFSGMVGDPCAAPNFLEVCEVIRQRAPHINIKISTNGGMKNPDWWAKLANILGKGSWIRFAIDGLEDTNEIYRVGVKWPKVIENAQAFINAGGEAEWQWIAFHHNEHQIEIAKQYSKTLGFDRFIVRRSHKFLFDALFEMNYTIKGIPIQQPTTKEYVHPLILHKNKKYKLSEALQLSENSQISCDAQSRRSVYISAEGFLFPCVYTATCLHLYKHKNLGDSWQQLWDDHGNEKINLYNKDWNEILHGSFFNNISDGWNNNYANGRLAACGLVCSQSEARIFDSKVEYDIKEC
jgi:MoaA/NifB/PqqE/SkfB family radical SAM enzyme